MRHKRFGKLTIAFALSLGVGATVEGAIYRVDDSAPGGNGSSWPLAINNLQTALNLTLYPNDEIWVAQGTYYPDELAPGDRTKSFRLVSGVKLLAGYAGYGAPDPDERNIALYPTILSGDIDQGGGYTNNSYHVVVSDWTPERPVVDGFTIEYGNANDADEFRYLGGGILGQGAVVSFVRCTIRNNQAMGEGYEDGLGGGVAFMPLQIGPNVIAGEPLFIDCSFHDNVADDGGGAICLTGKATASFVNSLIYENNGGEYGGATYSEIRAATLSLVNCTIADNTASEQGGGCYFKSQSGGTLENCIIWGNSGSQIYLDGTPIPVVSVTYSDVQGEWTGEGNINADPEFVSDYRLDTDPENLSPCIDVGDNSKILVHPDIYDLDGDGGSAEPTPDLDVTGRIANCTVDMGAYEMADCAIEDVNVDGRVDIDDIFCILAEWGPCQTTPRFYCDVAGPDGKVNIDDLFTVLNAWDDCNGGSTPPQGVWDCLARYGSDPQALQTCIEAMSIIAEN